MIVHPVLSALARNEARLGLRRLRSFISTLDSGLGSYPIIHVAGTNGKGSVVTMLSAVLQQAGYRVGSFTSPHLQRLNERIQIDGEEISDAELDALLAELDAARDAWSRDNTGHVDAEATLNFFEMLTAAGLVHMGRAGVDVGIVEVGMGGRLDATNLVEPLVSAIVTVSMDHRDRLGPDIASIASEKAGVIKPGRPVVVGPLPSGALKVVRLTAHERDAELIVSGESFRTLGADGGRFTWTSGGQTLRDLSLGLNGEHQVDNAGVALAILQAVADQLPVSPADVAAGLDAARHPGRLEWLDSDLLIDAAHNGDGAAALARYLAALPRDRPRTLVLGVSRGKDSRAMAVQLSPHVDRIMTTHCSHRRAAPAADIAAALVGVDLPVLPAGPIEQALPLARDGEALVIVAGSVYIAGAARDIFEGSWHGA